MQIDNVNMNNGQSRNRFLDITLIAVALTVIFHFLPADHPFGMAFAIFVACLAVGMVLVASISGRPSNRWSYLFLLPVFLSALADAIYASHVVQGLAFIISLGSLSLFAFWSTVPHVSFRRVKEFWPFVFFKDTVWPFGSLTHYLSRIKGDRRLGGAAIGAIIALPFLLIFAAMFAAADPLFSKSFSGLFQNANFGAYVFKAIRDIIVGIYFLAAGVMMLTRLSDDKEKPTVSSERHQGIFSQTVFATFLGLINVLFLVFVGFQFAYFFGGQGFLVAQGITYADYAREGFFQLLFVAGVVFGISWVIYYMTEMRQTWTKILNVSLIVETGIIIASAIKRLLLYIDAYGLTLSRWWAMYCIILIGLTLLVIVVLAILKVSYATASKFAFLGILMITSSALLVPTERMIARYNIDRFLSGKDLSASHESSLDFSYLGSLSSDAVAERIRLANAQWPADPTQDLYAWQTNQGSYLGQLKNERDQLKKHISDIGLGATFSDYWALDALDGLR